MRFSIGLSLALVAFVSAIASPPARAVAAATDLQATQAIQSNSDPAASQTNPQSGASQLLQPAGTNDLQVSANQLSVAPSELGGQTQAPSEGWRRYWPGIAAVLVIIIVGCLAALAYRLRRNQATG